VIGEPLADRLLPADAKSRLVGPETVQVSGDLSYRYAGASTNSPQQLTVVCKVPVHDGPEGGDGLNEGSNEGLGSLLGHH
jgi:hypothetical protein